MSPRRGSISVEIPRYDSSRLLREEPLAVAPQKHNHWHLLVRFQAFCAEVANVGIVLVSLSRWFPRITFLLLIPEVAFMILVADPMIYFFRALIRLTRIIGRECFGVKFVEEELGSHPLQTLGDLAALCFFSLAVALFLGSLIAPPIGITIAWAMGLGGLCVVGYFDYSWPATLAYAECERLANDPEASQEVKDTAEQDYQAKLNSKRLFMALLLGLSLLLLCGSALAFAPVAIAPILLITSKVASLFLTCIACGRFFNWCFSSPDVKPDPDDEEVELEPGPLLAVRRSLSEQLHGSGLYHEPAPLQVVSPSTATVQNEQARPSPFSFYQPLASDDEEYDENPYGLVEILTP